MKILMVANGYPPTAVGGVETYTAELSRSLLHRGHQVNVFCRESDFSKADYEISTQLQDEISITRVVNDHKQATSFRQIFSDPHLEQIFTDFILAEQPDLIHFNHLIGLSARLPLISAAQNIPTVITLHDFWAICHQVKLIDWQGHICPGPAYGVDCSTCVIGGLSRHNVSPLAGKSTRLVKRILPARLRRALRTSFPGGESRPPAMVSSPQIFTERLALFTQAIQAAQQVLVPSEYVRRELSNNGFPPEHITVLPLGIVMQSGNKPVNSRSHLLTFAAIGPLQPIKGMDIAIRAFSKVPGDHLRLKIYGRHDLYPREHVQQVFALAQADPRVSLEGPFDPEDRAEIFDSFDILLVPSPAPETFSLVAHEALAQGKPVLASRLGALADIIQDGTNGYLFEPGNDSQLAKLISAFAANPELIEKGSILGSLSIFTPDEHARQVETIYRYAMEKNG